MKITVCSLDIAWEDKQKNFEKVESLLSQIENPEYSETIEIGEEEITIKLKR